MTIDVFTRAALKLIQTPGPHAIPHPYADVTAIRVTATAADGTETVLIWPTDYTVAPTSSLTGGSLTLTAEAFDRFAGQLLEIDRRTPATQGWFSPQTGADRGLERQLDQLTMSVQELRRDMDGAVRVRDPIGRMVEPGNGQTIVWDANGRRFVPGPDAGQISEAIDHANRAEAAANAVQQKLGVHPDDFFPPGVTPTVSQVTAAIQQAIDHVASLGGGVVDFYPRPYEVNDTIIIRSNVELRGQSPSFSLDYIDNALVLRGSWITMAPGVNKDVVKVVYDGPPVPSGNYPRIHATLRSIGTHGNRSGLAEPLHPISGLPQVDRNNAGSGIVLEGVSYVSCYDVIVLRCAEHGVQAFTAGDEETGYRTTNNVTLRGCVSIGNVLDGYNMFGGDSTIHGCVGGFNGRDGYNGSMGPVIGGKWWNNKRYGAIIQGFGIVFDGNDAYDNGRTGIRLESGTGIVVSNNKALDNGRLGLAAVNDRAGISIAAAVGNCVITGNSMSVQNGRFRIAFTGALVRGSGYPNGTHIGVPLTGGTGTGATADLTVSGGQVTELIMNNRGTGYTDGDVLTVAPGALASGSGFAITVTLTSYRFPGNQMYGIAASSGAPNAVITGNSGEGVILYEIANTSRCKFDEFRYGSRAAMVTDLADIPRGAVAQVGTLAWIRDGGAGIADMPGFTPLGLVYPDHYADNAVPGTTDMTAAIQAASTFARALYFRGVDHRISGPITTSTTSRSWQGVSHQATIITLAHASGDGFVVDSTSSAVTDVRFSDMTIRGLTGLARTSGAHIRFPKTVIRLEMENVRMHNYWDAVRFPEANTCVISKCWFSQFGMPAGHKGNHTFNNDRDYVSQNAGAIDLHFHDCQFSGANTAVLPWTSGCVSHIRTNSVDGIYIDVCHFFYSDYTILVNPDPGTPAHNVCASIKATGCYFDTTFIHHVFMTGSPPDATKYREFTFDACEFREAGDAAIHLDGPIGRITLSACSLRQNQREAIKATNAAIYDLQVADCRFNDNNVANTAIHDIDYGGNGVILANLQMTSPRAAGGAIRMRASAQDYDITGIHTVKHANAAPILLESNDGYLDGVRKVTNANGTYFQHRDGRLRCQRVIDVNVASSALQNFTLPLGLAAGSRADAVAHWSHLTSTVNAALYTANIQRFGCTETAWFLVLATPGTSSAPGTQAERLTVSVEGRWR